MKYVISMLLSMVCLNSIAGGFSPDNLKAIESFFQDFYKTNFVSVGDDHHLCGGAYASSLISSPEGHDMREYLRDRLYDKGKTKKAIIESLLTQFAYAQPSVEEQNQFAETIYERISKEFMIYAVSPHDLEGLCTIPIKESAEVSSPSLVMVLMENKPEYRKSKVRVAYMVHSDVND